MKKLGLLSVMMVLLFACAEKKADQPVAPETTVAAEPTPEEMVSDDEVVEEVAPSPIIDGINAGKIFKTSCAVCHGVDGKLGINGAKDLTTATTTLEERVTQITNGKGLMTPFGSILKAEEIQAVAKYTMQLK